MAKSKTPRVFSYKRCPDCFVNIELMAKVCPGCHRRVGKVNRQGLAKRPANYLGYLAVLFWIGLFIGYIWFFFVR